MAFTRKDEDWLTWTASRGDRATLKVTFELATRLRLRDLQLRTRNRMADLLSDELDAKLVKHQLSRWQELGLLEAKTVARALKGHVRLSPLEGNAALWSDFFAQLPRRSLPMLFEVHYFMGRGSSAVHLAQSPIQEEQESHAACAHGCSATCRPDWNLPVVASTTKTFEHSMSARAICSSHRDSMRMRCHTTRKLADGTW